MCPELTVAVTVGECYIHVSEQRVGQLMKGSDTNVSEGYSIVI